MKKILLLIILCFTLLSCNQNNIDTNSSSTNSFDSNSTDNNSDINTTDIEVTDNIGFQTITKIELPANSELVFNRGDKHYFPSTDLFFVKEITLNKYAVYNPKTNTFSSFIFDAPNNNNYTKATLYEDTVLYKRYDSEIGKYLYSIWDYNGRILIEETLDEITHAYSSYYGTVVYRSSNNAFIYNEGHINKISLSLNISETIIMMTSKYILTENFYKYIVYDFEGNKLKEYNNEVVFINDNNVLENATRLVYDSNEYDCIDELGKKYTIKYNLYNFDTNELIENVFPNKCIEHVYNVYSQDRYFFDIPFTFFIYEDINVDKTLSKEKAGLINFKSEIFATDDWYTYCRIIGENRFQFGDNIYDYSGNFINKIELNNVLIEKFINDTYVVYEFDEEDNYKVYLCDKKFNKISADYKKMFLTTDSYAIAFDGIDTYKIYPDGECEKIDAILEINLLEEYFYYYELYFNDIFYVYGMNGQLLIEIADVDERVYSNEKIMVVLKNDEYYLINYNYIKEWSKFK